ncbi:MAG: hypothetical protein PVF83_11435 [Anaerolineales bacterium]|jgi:hypothetical protein
MKSRFRLLLIIGTIVFQCAIFFFGQVLANDREGRLHNLENIATEQMIRTETWIAKNPPTPMPTYTFTPMPPTPTPITCTVRVAESADPIIIYLQPSVGNEIGAVELREGEIITLVGKLKDEPWWKAYIKDSGDQIFGWIRDESVVVHNPECALVKEESLSSIMSEPWEYIPLVEDTFSGFEYEWVDENENLTPNTTEKGFAQLYLEDRGPSDQSTESIARLSNQEIPNPFELRVSYVPFSRYGKSYVGFRFRSATEPEGSWIDFRLARSFCTIEWRVSISGEETNYPSFELGDSGECGNDEKADYILIKVVSEPDTGKIRISGIYNNYAIPSIPVYDHDHLFDNISFELIASHSVIKYDYILLVQPE